MWTLFSKNNASGSDMTYLHNSHHILFPLHFSLKDLLKRKDSFFCIQRRCWNASRNFLPWKVQRTSAIKIIYSRGLKQEHSAISPIRNAALKWNVKAKRHRKHIINFLIKICSCVNQFDKLKFKKQQINCFTCCLCVKCSDVVVCLHFQWIFRAVYNSFLLFRRKNFMRLNLKSF